MTQAIESLDHQSKESSIRDWWVLTKPGVMTLVVFSGATGVWLAPGELNLFLQLLVILSIAMGSAAGAIFNMVYDQDIDRIMQRTQKRPLIRGVIPGDDAGLLAIFLSIVSVSLLGLASNWYAAGLLAFSIFFYAVIYTVLLKRHTPQNIVIGGAAGAFPPVIGWLAVTGSASAALPWLLFLIIFLWTPPHFWALALYRNDDYRRANIPMMPVTAGAQSTKRQMVVYTVLLALSTLAVPAIEDKLGLFSYGFCSALSAGFMWHAMRVWRNDCGKIAMNMFGYSIIYLFAIFSVYLLDFFIVSA